ncbi:sigma-70 family RNA polymerase sigma factor [Nocardioides sp. WS12]|uniref:sigma-70 family RNA polymerase sigma factor n=1 Tax=Nocardioides sp. WS12 TaxID=2486272 RepID=UPI0015FB6366|nr:sigma-70 family RNA polymerase sigma factor [Nocardioides sp. WS12]
MTETLEPAVVSLSDEALLDLVRSGDVSAWAELFGRHHQAATRMARGVDPSNADDLVSEAFTRVYLAARKGAGVRSAFRAYLFQTIRNLAVNRFQRDRRIMWVDELPDHGADTAASGQVDDRMTSEMLVDAFRSLPPRWQTVLWHTAVEGEDHQVVGRIMGLKPNAVAALSFRARDGLRRAYIDAHVAATDVAECQAVRRLVPGHVLGKLSRREQERVASHLDECNECSAVVLEVVSVNGRPGAALLPAIVGPVLAAGYVDQGGAPGTLLSHPTPLLALDKSHHGVLAAAGVALVLMLGAAGASVVLLTDDPGKDGPVVSAPATSLSTETAAATPEPSATPRSPAATPVPSASVTPPAAPSTVLVPVSPDPSTRRPVDPETTVASQPVPPTRADLAITGGSVTSYPDHEHLQLTLGPESSASGTLITFRVLGLESFAAHRRGEFRPGICELTDEGAAGQPSEVTCTLSPGTADFALDVVIPGELVVSAEVSANNNIDPDPNNNNWQTP